MDMNICVYIYIFSVYIYIYMRAPEYAGLAALSIRKSLGRR